MKGRPYLSTARAAAIFEQAMSWRQTFCQCNDYRDNHFFKVPTFLSWLFGDDENWSIKKFQSKPGEDLVRKAAIVVFDGRVTLTVNQAIWEGAEQGKWFDNFMLAHELGHLGLDHHTRSAVTKNFQLTRLNNVNSNLPPTMQ